MKEYTGSTYIGVVGPDLEYGQARDSISQILLRPGDGAPVFGRFTKGYEARQAHIDKFLESHHAFLLLLDTDMVFPADCLERLRRHKLPYVSGLYMRRRFAPIAPVWYEPWCGAWPVIPWHTPIERGRLHELGGSGWGCVLIHREVIQSVRLLLKGEWEVLEDDMDLYPYDLPRVISAIRGLRALLAERPGMPTLLPALEAHTRTLEDEIKPLRADKRDIIGSDIRFPWFARLAGYPLMGDPDVRCGHILDYPITPDDYDGQEDNPQAAQALLEGVRETCRAEHRRIRSKLAEVGQ